MAHLNPFTGDLLPGQRYDGGASGTGWAGEVTYYADLPDPTTVSGQVYLVTTETAGDWWTAFLNKKPAGLYQSNGTVWKLLPNNLYLYSMGDTSITSGNIGDLKILGYNATNHVWEPKTGADLGLQAITATDNYQTGAYSLVAADNGKIIKCNGTFTVTLPDNDTTSPDLPVGFTCIVWNVGTGIITLAAESLTSEGTKINSKKAATVWKESDVDADTAAWYGSGGLST